MATSAIGPGFLTQTTVFTEKLAASFGFVILVSILIDIGAQLNVWRIIAVTGKRGQEIANEVFPGLAILSLCWLLPADWLSISAISAAVVLASMSSLVFLLFIGAVISAVIAIGIFLNREAGYVMDRFTQVAGVCILLLTLYVAVTSGPPVGEAVSKTFVPDSIDIMSIVTLVGGTVGGYITFAGGHRLVDAVLRQKRRCPK